MLKHPTIEKLTSLGLKDGEILVEESRDVTIRIET